MSNPVTQDDPDPRFRPPLGLPPGSVRALLTLMVLAVVVVESMRGHAHLLVGLWNETLLVAVVHYFTARRLVRVPHELRQKLEADGHLPREAPPLFLPRYTIRVLIVAGLAGLTYHTVVIQNVREFSKIPSLLIAVWAYMLGTFVRGFLRMIGGGRAPSGLWADLRATAVLLLMLGTAIPFFLGRGDLVPDLLRSISLACVLFYFGCR